MKLNKTSVLMMLIVSILILTTFTVGAEEQKELKKVRIGVPPYSMYMIFFAAHSLGIDKEFGLDFDIKEFTATLPAVQAMIHGDIDISGNCIAEHLVALKGAPQIKNFSTVGFFKGFIFVGRKDKTKPFSELLKEMDQSKAKEFQLNEFKGKEFAIIPQRKPLILDAIAQVGLKAEDIKFLQFADDQKAATAFIKGSGDFYIGSLPQEQRLLKMSDQFVNVGGSEILGPGGLWYDTMVSTDKFIKDERETALRTIATLYRAIKLFNEQPMKIAVQAAKALSRMTGGDFPVDQYIEFQTVYDDFLSIDEAKDGFYNNQSPLYWKLPVEYYMKMALEQGDLDKPISSEEYYGESEKLFNELLSRKDLVDLINAPFK
ncbi:MAG: ABC transporter substrate-binding protein [Candidatus Atribacteria bacterium]|nr:ABC transporter substrate-binding protein [Candidatus Atribacteria bacterium]